MITYVLKLTFTVVFITIQLPPVCNKSTTTSLLHFARDTFVKQQNNDDITTITLTTIKVIQGTII